MNRSVEDQLHINTNWEKTHCIYWLHDYVEIKLITSPYVLDDPVAGRLLGAHNHVHQNKMPS